MIKRSSKKYIDNQLDQNPSWNILDIGCGYTAHKKANVICDVQDLSEFYKGRDFIKLKGKTLPFKDKEFDFVITSHVIEHVEDVNFFLMSCSKLLKKNGIMFIATLNKTLKSYIFAIIGAEYILRWLPIGTHDWNKFVKPENLEDICNKNSLKLKSIDGVKFNPILNKWKLSNDKSVNYITKYKKS